MIEELVRLIVAPAALFSTVSLWEYVYCFEQTYRDIPRQLNIKQRLQLSTDYFRELYFNRKGYLVPLVFTTPIYAQFIIDKFVK